MRRALHRHKTLCCLVDVPRPRRPDQHGGKLRSGYGFVRVVSSAANSFNKPFRCSKLHKRFAPMLLHIGKAHRIVGHDVHTVRVGVDHHIPYAVDLYFMRRDKLKLLRRFVIAERAPLLRHVGHFLRHRDDSCNRLAELVCRSDRLPCLGVDDLDAEIDNRAHHFAVRQSVRKRRLNILVAGLVGQGDLEADIFGFEIVRGKQVLQPRNKGCQIDRYLVTAVRRLNLDEKGSVLASKLG